MSSCPLVAWSFAFHRDRDPAVGDDRALPVHRAGRQCRDLASARRRRRRGWRPTRRHRGATPATTGAVPSVRFDHTGCSRPPLNSQRLPCPPPVATNTHFPFQTAGSEKTSVAPGADIVCSSPPVVAFTPGEPMQLQQPQHAVLPALHDVAAGSSAGPVEPRSTSAPFSCAWFAGVQCRSRREASGESTSTLSPQFVRAVRTARCRWRRARSPLPGSTTAPCRAQIAESLAQQVRRRDHSCRSLAERVPDVRDPAGRARIDRHDVTLVRRRVADVAARRRSRARARR